MCNLCTFSSEIEYCIIFTGLDSRQMGLLNVVVNYRQLTCYTTNRYTTH